MERVVTIPAQTGVFPFNRLPLDLQVSCIGYLDEEDKKVWRLVNRSWQRTIDARLMQQGGLSVKLYGNELHLLTGELKLLMRHFEAGYESFMRGANTHAAIRHLRLRDVDFSQHPLPELLQPCTRLETLDLYSCTNLTPCQLWQAQPYLPSLASIESMKGSPGLTASALTAFPALSKISTSYGEEIDPAIMAARSANLREIDCGNSSWSQGSLQVLAERASRLQRLNINSFTSDGYLALPQLSKLPCLQELCVYQDSSEPESPINASDFVVGLSRLKSLELGGVSRSRECLSLIGAKCKSLATLSIYSLTQKEVDRAANVDWQALTSLSLSAKKTVDFSKWLARTPSLDELEVTDSDGGGTYKLGALSNLQKFSTDTESIELDCGALSQARSLTFYVANWEKLSLAPILSGPFQLSILYLSFIPDLASLLQQGAIPTCLKKLDLHKVQDEILPMLVSQCPQLEEINLWESADVTGESLQGVTAVRLGLRHLFCPNGKITDKGLEALIQVYPKLESLSITNTQLTNVGIAQMSRWTQLNQLTFSAVDVTDDVVKQLISQLPGLRFFSWREAPMDFLQYLDWEVGTARN